MNEDDVECGYEAADSNAPDDAAIWTASVTEDPEKSEPEAGAEAQIEQGD